MRFLSLLAFVVMVMSACSSSTVVARDERATQNDQAQSDAASSEAADDGSSSDQADSDDREDDEEIEDDRGSRNDTDTTPLTPRELEEAEGFGLGGAEQLGGLQRDCESGNNMACDILFELSAFDSPEEATALSCGGRSEAIVIFCTEGVTSIDDELVFDIASEGLGGIVSQCEAGDMTACDFLYFRSPFESEFEEIGATCGGRVEVAVPDCRTFVTE